MPQAPLSPKAPRAAMPPSGRAAAGTGFAPAPKILRIGIIQGARIVEERLVRKRQDVTIGQSTKNMFVIPTEALPKTFTLFEVTVADPQQADAVAAAIDAKVKDRFQVPTETKPQSAHARTALAVSLTARKSWPPR